MRAYDPLEVALPKLLRRAAATRRCKRVAMARGAGLHAEPMFTLLAADWIKAALHEPWATVRDGAACSPSAATTTRSTG